MDYTPTIDEQQPSNPIQPRAEDYGLPSTFVWQAASGHFYQAASGYYYDIKRRLYYFAGNFFRLDRSLCKFVAVPDPWLLAKNATTSTATIATAAKDDAASNDFGDDPMLEIQPVYHDDHEQDQDEMAAAEVKRIVSKDTKIEMKIDVEMGVGLGEAGVDDAHSGSGSGSGSGGTTSTSITPPEEKMIELPLIDLYQVLDGSELLIRRLYQLLDFDKLECHLCHRRLSSLDNMKLHVMYSSIHRELLGDWKRQQIATSSLVASTVASSAGAAALVGDSGGGRKRRRARKRMLQSAAGGTAIPGPSSSSSSSEELSIFFFWCYVFGFFSFSSVCVTMINCISVRCCSLMNSFLNYMENYSSQNCTSAQDASSARPLVK